MSQKIKSDAIVRIISNNVDIDIFAPFKIQSDSEGIGSGFFINNKGYILTCAHVVSGSIKLWINTPMEGKKKIPVVIHSICYDKDLAVLKTVDYQNKDFCKLGNSDKVSTENNVLTVGYPLGQDRLKKTKGIISGIQDRYIQIDAPINPGNSGGPLFNSEMEVIGINTAKMMSMFAENIGYATPINDFHIISKKMTHDQQLPQIVYEPFFYCELQITSNNHYKLFKCPEKYGCIVKNLVRCTPLWEAGLRENDILLEFDKYKIDGNGDVDVEWSNDKVGFYDLKAKCTDDINYNLVYWSLQNQKIIKTTVMLNNTTGYKIKNVRHPFEQFNFEIFAGMVIMELTMNHIENLDKISCPKQIRCLLDTYRTLNKRTDNVIFIASILQGSYISTIEDLSQGSIIDNVNGQKVKTLEDFRFAITNHVLKMDGKYIMYLKLRDKSHILVNLNDALSEEHILSTRYKYTVSDLYKITNVG